MTGAGSAGLLVRATLGDRSDGPIAASAVAGATGGTVAAAAGPSSRIGTSPFTTTR